MEQAIKHIPLAMLLSFIGKMLFTDVSLAQMGVVFALTSLVALQNYLEKQSTLQDIKLTVAKQNEVIEKLAKEMVELRTGLGAYKMQQSMKRVG